ncbi:O-acetyl-ADP-ribose deacetylase [Virgibacillus chiguensis]|uniref:O-acetyl-ADP-ribose deacetylase (Regulator of RNase III), contains Macro domain n=1 Tax=Virgibacillus chiguensis TaxID=411959 RepID=A0A1M5X4U0_9BACI|nr:O-acetyl-ADP-ribose deacetylase [Virgibacillus chiguensis]SHH94890.1 O-acetyl-ADP-ribose deacetylase (regulator of RNase III), contains Macro domain [Virgibacillus chiguensis]
MHILIGENRLELTIGDITKEKTEAIVNAANGSLMGGGGVDGAIHQAAGPELLQACRTIRKQQLKGEPLGTGEAVITAGYHLPASYVIHTVGPIWDDHHPNQDKQLASCYLHALKLAQEHHLSSIAFPSISTGVYRFPIKLAAEIAIRTVTNYLQTATFGQVKIVLFSEADFRVYQSALKHITDSL